MEVPDTDRGLQYQSMPFLFITKPIPTIWAISSFQQYLKRPAAHWATTRLLPQIKCSYLNTFAQNTFRIKFIIVPAII